MGICGFPSFLGINVRSLSTEVLLSNTRLVIDVNDLIRWKRKKSCPGGDLVSFGRSMRRFFHDLEMCKIQPILIFGGPILYNTEQREAVLSRQETYYQRGIRQFNHNNYYKGHKIYAKLIPASRLKMILSNVAREAGIQMIQTPYNKIAQKANELKCPVLTNESDFIIYDLEYGFSKLDYFKYRSLICADKLDGEAPKIRCSLFSQAKLAETLPGGINREIWPLLSILLGNDYIDVRIFEDVKRSICGYQYEDALDIPVYQRLDHRRMTDLLTWMSGKSLQEALDYILKSVDYQQIDRERLLRLIEFCLAKYQPESTIEFDEELERLYPSHQVDPSLVELGQTPVQLLKRLLEQNDLVSIAFDMLFRKAHSHHPILLDSDSDRDSNRCTQSRCIECRPDSLALVLIRSQANTNSFTNGTEPAAHHIDHRVKSESPTKVPIRPMEYLEKFGSLRHIDCYSMITMERELKKDMLMACFRFNMDEFNLMTYTVGQVLSGPYVQEAALCFMLVNYIGLQTQLPPESQFVDALVLTIFCYAASNGHINRQNGILDEAGVKRMMDIMELHSKINNGAVYNKDVESIDRRITHRIGQLFSAFKAYSLINSLLDYPLDMPRLERYFNSTLVFRLTKLFHLRELTREINFPILIDICAEIRSRVQCAE